MTVFKATQWAERETKDGRSSNTSSPNRCARCAYIYVYIYMRIYIHRRFIYKGDARTHAQGTYPRVALGADGELPTHIYTYAHMHTSHIHTHTYVCICIYSSVYTCYAMG